MNEILKEVFIKAVLGGGSDKVVRIANLPKRFLYTLAPKTVHELRNGYDTGAAIVVPGEFVDALHPGIELSQTGDGAFCFNTYMEESNNRLKDILDYVKKNTPKDHDRIEMVPYAEDPSDSRSRAKHISEIPLVSLNLLDLSQSKVAPQPVSPPEALASAPVASTPSLTDEERLELEEFRAKKKAAQERMATARAKSK